MDKGRGAREAGLKTIARGGGLAKRAASGSGPSVTSAKQGMLQGSGLVRDGRLTGGSTGAQGVERERCRHPLECDLGDLLVILIRLLFVFILSFLFYYLLITLAITTIIYLF